MSRWYHHSAYSHYHMAYAIVRDMYMYNMYEGIKDCAEGVLVR